VRDACSLLSKQEIESIQGASVTGTKSSEHFDDSFRVAQCFYTTAEFSKSVSLALVQENPGQQNKRSPKDFWKEKFGPYSGNEKEHDGRAETRSVEKEQGTAPKKIADLGDEAYWVSNRFGGVLYVLKGDAFISVGLGGTDDEEYLPFNDRARHYRRAFFCHGYFRYCIRTVHRPLTFGDAQFRNTQSGRPSRELGWDGEWWRFGGRKHLCRRRKLRHVQSDLIRYAN
jgi:hypothetical protein